MVFDEGACHGAALGERRSRCRHIEYWLGRRLGMDRRIEVSRRCSASERCHESVGYKSCVHRCSSPGLVGFQGVAAGVFERVGVDHYRLEWSPPPVSRWLRHLSHRYPPRTCIAVLSNTNASFAALSRRTVSSTPSTLATFKFKTSWNLVGRCTGSSFGFTPECGRCSLQPPEYSRGRQPRRTQDHRRPHSRGPCTPQESCALQLPG